MTEAADTEYRALVAALDTYQPPCTGDDRYIADDIDEATRAELNAGCDLCRIRDLCAAYAQRVRPKGGLWAGKRYSHSAGGRPR